MFLSNVHQTNFNASLVHPFVPQPAYFFLQEASAVQRVKRALKTQLKLRADAARKAQRLRGAGQAERSRREGDADGSDGKDATATRELKDLEERVAETSKVRACVALTSSPRTADKKCVCAE